MNAWKCPYCEDSHPADEPCVILGRAGMPGDGQPIVHRAVTCPYCGDKRGPDHPEPCVVNREIMRSGRVLANVSLHSYGPDLTGMGSIESVREIDPRDEHIAADHDALRRVWQYASTIDRIAVDVTGEYAALALIAPRIAPAIEHMLHTVAREIRQAVTGDD